MGGVISPRRISFSGDSEYPLKQAYKFPHSTEAFGLACGKSISGYFTSAQIWVPAYLSRLSTAHDTRAQQKLTWELARFHESFGTIDYAQSLVESTRRRYGYQKHDSCGVWQIGIDTSQ